MQGDVEYPLDEGGVPVDRRTCEPFPAQPLLQFRDVAGADLIEVTRPPRRFQAEPVEAFLIPV